MEDSYFIVGFGFEFEFGFGVNFRPRLDIIMNNSRYINSVCTKRVRYFIQGPLPDLSRVGTG